SFALDENSAAQTLLGSVTGTDPDNGPNGMLVYTITSGNIGAAFAIDPNSGAITVASQAALNFEVTPAFSLTITATDGGTPTLLDTATVTVTLNDVNEQPRAFPGTMTTIENAVNTATLGAMIATDEDRGDSGVLRYSIIGGSGSTALAIDPVSGTIFVQDSTQLDFETSPTLEIVVQATDMGTPSLSDTNTVTLSLIDLNEAPNVDDQTFALDEHSLVGTLVGTVSAADPDTGFNGLLRYAITAGNQFGAFVIDANSGEIHVASSIPLNFESRTNLTFSVTVTDSGVPSYSDTAQITVNLNDINEAPGLLRPFAPVIVTTVPTTIVSNLTLNFIDIETPSEQLTFTVDSVSNSDLLTASITDGTNLTVTVNSGFTGSGTITLRATDSQGLFADAQFVITVPSQINPPSLTIERIGANIRISWPSTETGWIVESRPFASPAPPWTAESFIQVLMDGRTQIDIPISGTGRFYRLRRP
ncbi:MAG: cadherin domain-containing protein, partial [Limisphaerales bacterium]